MRSRNLLLIGAVLLLLLGLVATNSFAQTSPSTEHQNSADSSVLFENVRIFDGVSKQLSAASNVLVVGNQIQTISIAAIAAPPDASMTRIPGDGRVLMPGLIDAHTHLFMQSLSPEKLAEAATASPDVLFQQAAENATAMLLRGFTSARDMAGPVFALKESIDQGRLVGPRIWPSGAMVSQTAGHGDFRELTELPRQPTTELSLAEQFGVGAIADGVPEVLRSVREQLMKGASQIKLAAGGGVASAHDPIDVSQYTEAELRAAVEAAADWNTYVAVHAYTPEAIQKSIRAGVKSIEHGQLLDEATAQLIAENDVWLSLQPFLDDEDANPYPAGSPNRVNQLRVARGTDTAYTLVKQYNLKTAWGTDTLFNPEGGARQGAKLAKLVRWYTPAEVLQMATHTNAELLALSGPRNPYPGRLGIVEEGALADLILVDGNPLDNIDLISDPGNTFLVIMKDGKIFKNSLT